MRLFLPKTYDSELINNILNDKGYLVFLAGPIAGAENWQDQAIRMIHDNDTGIYVASPRRISEYSENALKGKESFQYQLDWERLHMDAASKHGAILFWLPKQVDLNINKSYARDTRGELGEWRGRLIYDKNINLVIGAEKGFDGLGVIKRNYQSVIPGMKFHSTLEETCDAVLELIDAQKKQ